MELVKGTRVTDTTGRTGTINGYDTGSVTNTEHANYGRKYVGVTWDATEEIPWGQHSRPFVDELTVVPAEEPSYRVIPVVAGFAVRDDRSGNNVARVGSRYGAEHIISCLRDGSMVVNDQGEAVNAPRCGAVDPDDLDACGKCRDCGRYRNAPQEKVEGTLVDPHTWLRQ